MAELSCTSTFDVMGIVCSGSHYAAWRHCLDVSTGFDANLVAHRPVNPHGVECSVLTTTLHLGFLGDPSMPHCAHAIPNLQYELLQARARRTSARRCWR